MQAVLSAPGIVRLSMTPVCICETGSIDPKPITLLEKTKNKTENSVDRQAYLLVSELMSNIE